MPSYPIGRLNRVHASPGTLLGPDINGQLYAVAEQLPDGISVGFATVQDIEAAKARLVAGEPPRSMAEWHMLALEGQLAQLRQAAGQ